MAKRVSFMEMIYVDSSDNARHTNQRAAMATNALTLKAFRSYKRLEVPSGKSVFLLDYHTAAGNLGDTIRLDVAGFEAITGERRKSDAAYRKIDQRYWAAAVKKRDKDRANANNL